jgi:O-antigen ligase
MEQYSNKILAPWDKQPPHNFFIIVAAEMGIPAMLILVWIFLSHLHKLVSSIKYQVLSKNREHTTYYILLATIFICFLILMQFDHYFYTLQQTQMLLWLILGIIAAEIKTKNESTAKI